MSPTPPPSALDAPLSERDPGQESPADRITRPDVPGVRLAASEPPAVPSVADPAADLDDLSLSAEFFSRDPLDSFAPLESELAEELAPEAAPPPSAQQLARRSRLRRAVGGFVGLVAAACVVVVAVNATGPQRRAQAADATPPPVTLDARETTVAPPAELEAASVQAPRAHDAEPADPEPADAEPTDAEPANRDDAAEPAGLDAEALRKDALRLLNQAKYADAIQAAERAIAADPADALPYLLKGSAHSDLGERAAAIEAYSECVRHATRGAIYECSALGGRK